MNHSESTEIENYPSMDELYALYTAFMEEFRQIHGEHHTPLSLERFESTIRYYAPTAKELAPFLEDWRKGYIALTTHPEESFHELPVIAGITNSRVFYQQQLAFLAEVYHHPGEGTFPVHIDSPKSVFSKLTSHSATVAQQEIAKYKKGYAKVIQEGRELLTRSSAEEIAENSSRVTE